MNRLILVGASIIVGFLAGLAVVVALPSSIPYSMANKGPLGYSSLYTTMGATPVNLESMLDAGSPMETAILISSLHPPENSTVEYLKSYLEHGGLVVAAGPDRFLNALLAGLGVDAEVNNASIYDMVYNHGGNRSLVRAETGCRAQITLYKPHPVTGALTIIAWTSNYSYADANGNGYLDITEEIASQPVAGRVDIGMGTLIIIASPYVFTNNLLPINKAFLDCILDDRRLLVDQSQVYSNPFERLKLEVSYQSGQAETLATAVASAVIGVLAYGVARRI